METARFWASRVEQDSDGRATCGAWKVQTSITPNVDDNAYTNNLARWNLARALDAV